MYFFLRPHVEVILQLLLGRASGVVDVAQDDAVLQQDDAGADVHRVVQVVAGDEDGGAVLLIILLQQVLDDGLAGRVEEVERLVQDEQARVVNHSGDDAY